MSFADVAFITHDQTRESSLQVRSYLVPYRICNLAGCNLEPRGCVGSIAFMIWEFCRTSPLAQCKLVIDAIKHLKLRYSLLAKTKELPSWMKQAVAVSRKFVGGALGGDCQDSCLALRSLDLNIIPSSSLHVCSYLRTKPRSSSQHVILSTLVARRPTMVQRNVPAKCFDTVLTDAHHGVVTPYYLGES